MTKLSINGQPLDVDYDEDLFPLYVTLSPDLGTGFKYVADGVFLSHDGRMKTESTSSDSMSVEEDPDIDLALLDYSEIIKCGPGNKPCGQRCIPKKWTCRDGEVDVDKESKKAEKKTKIGNIAAVVAVASIAVVGVAVYANREKIKTAAIDAANNAAVGAFDELTSTIREDTDYESMSDRQPLTKEDIIRAAKAGAKKALENPEDPAQLVDRLDEYSKSGEAQILISNYLRNDKNRAKIREAVLYRLETDLPDLGENDGYQQLTRDLASMDTVRSLGKRVKRKVKERTGDNKLWKFLTTPVQDLGQFEFAEDGDFEPELDILNFVGRIGLCTGEMEDAPNKAIEFISATMVDDPVVCLMLVSLVAGLYPNEVINNDS
jgi:hypothetical protein